MYHGEKERMSVNTAGGTMMTLVSLDCGEGGWIILGLYISHSTNGLVGNYGEVVVGRVLYE